MSDAKAASATAQIPPCTCWYDRVALHEGHCCFRDWPGVHCHCPFLDGHAGACELAVPVEATP